MTVLRERAEYLDLRIVAKETLGWDRRELAAFGELEAAA